MTGDVQLAFLSDFIRRNARDPDAVRDLGLDDDLIVDGIVDSLMLLELVNHLEEQMEITITPEEIVYENFGSLRSMLVFVDTKKKGSIR